MIQDKNTKVTLIGVNQPPLPDIKKKKEKIMTSSSEKDSQSQQQKTSLL